MARYLWNTPEYKAQFEAYKAGEDLTSLFLEDNLIDVEMGSRHIQELTTAARALLRRRRSEIHTFSAGALETAGLDKDDFISASVTRNPAEDTFSFVRLYKVEQPSLKEIQKQRDLEGLHHQFAEEDGELVPKNEDPRPLEDQMNWARWNNHDLLRITDVFFRDSFMELDSQTEQVWSREARSISFGTVRPDVSVYMTLGHMIEFDKTTPTTTA